MVAVRRSGAIHSLDTMNHFFLSGEMVIAGRAMGVGRAKGEVEKDAEGIELARSLGRRMAWVLQKLNA